MATGRVARALEYVGRVVDALIRAFQSALLASLLVFSLACAESSTSGLGTATTQLYARTDSNATTVWSPRTRVAGRPSEDVTLEAVYTLDAWTSASIDIVTAATKAVHEVRHEANASAQLVHGDLTVAGRYRYSTEPDYVSHGAVLNVSLDLAQKNTTVALTAFGARDTVGRAGDPLFRELQQSYGGRVTLTQVLDRETLVQLSWDVTAVSGFQASPYRFVAIGGDGTCTSTAPLCLPETMPNERTRQALGLQAKRALGDATSIALTYRFYFDDWGVMSQTLSPELFWLARPGGTLSVSYRYYTQGEAEFYRPRYFSPTRFFTRDRELSALYAHRASVSYTQDQPLGRRGLVLSAALRISASYYRYLAFVGLEHVEALEATALLGLRFE
jgi:hypothetical protein